MHYSVLYKLLGGTWAYEESGILDKTHLRFFTANEAVRMFSEAGYEDVGASPINMYTSEQAMSFVDTLCKITSEKMKAQYLAFQYIIRAKKNQSLEVQMVKKRIEPVTEAVVVQNQFKEKRLKLVNAILNLSENDFNDFSQTTLYQEYKDLILSGIQNYPLLEGDYQNLYQILYCVNSGVPAWQIQRNIIGGLLYVRPYQLPFVFNLPDMPAGMMEFYLEQMFESPPIFLNKEDAERYYRFFKAWVGYLYSNILNNPTVSAWLTIAKVFLMKANLIPLYFNEANLKEIYIERAKICEAVLKTENYQLDYQFSKRPKDRKLRVGILALHYSPQTETFTTLPFYKHLNPEEFEVVLFALRRSGHPLEQYCGSYAQELVILPDNLPEQVNMIRSYDLDFALIGTNVTAVTNPMFLLASHRLARVQLVNNSSCTTTGMKNVDYYISGTFTEPLQSAQNQYSERLRMVDGPAHCIDFGSEANSEATMDFSRAYLGIDENEVIFVSGANFYKVIPELEEVWARIIAAVPNSRLLLYPFNKNWSNAYPEQQFAKRLVHTFKQFGLAEERFIIVPTVPTRTDVLNRLRLADIYLDSFPFTGINSLLDPLEAGLPVVVKAGDTFRSLMGASMLKELHMEEFITYTEDKYIELAVLLGQKPEARANFRQKVIEGMKMQPRFIDSVQYGKQIGRILKEIAQEQYF
jgi:predicted O-linked N-acetylglucosamine transferase (SPINDLY family)